MQTTDYKHSSIRGELHLACQDERWASDCQCYFNKTLIKLKNVHLVQVSVHNSLAFDPASKRCSVGCVELSKNDAATHVSLKITCSRPENEASDIVACLLKQKLCVFKYIKKPAQISLTFNGTGEKQLIKMNKELVLLDDPKQACLYLSVVSKN